MGKGFKSKTIFESEERKEFYGILISKKDAEELGLEELSDYAGWSQCAFTLDMGKQGYAFCFTGKVNRDALHLLFKLYPAPSSKKFSLRQSFMDIDSLMHNDGLSILRKIPSLEHLIDDWRKEK